VISKVWTYS